ncbi:MAG: sigma-70 family RNA polymerase sigma factor [Planctomycetota bacterium]
MTDDRYRQWIESHKVDGYRAAFRVVGNHEDALDALQEASLRLYERRHAVTPTTVGAWIRRVATNAAIDLVRRRATQRRALTQASHRHPEVASAAAPAEHAEAHQQVLDSLAALPPRQSEVIALRVYEELSFVEIAAQLGISETTAKTHFRRGITTLQQHPWVQTAKLPHRHDANRH